MKKIFLICPVRNATQNQIDKMMNYIQEVESTGDKIYYPARDNPYEDTDNIGYQICVENSQAIADADEIHIFWDKTSQGTLFDLGGAFMLEKPLKIVNHEDVESTEKKSFANMLLKWQNENRNN